MRNPVWCLLGILAVALRQPDIRQVILFKHPLDCVRTLVDFNIMVQYRSHTPERIAYMEEYLNRFHRMKDIFFQFRVSKPTRAKVDKQRKELPHQRDQSNMRVAPSKRHRRLEDVHDEDNDLRMDIIHTESHFNFVKMHLLSHFSDHIYPSLAISPYTSPSSASWRIRNRSRPDRGARIRTMSSDKFFTATVVSMQSE